VFIVLILSSHHVGQKPKALSDPPLALLTSDL